MALKDLFQKNEEKEERPVNPTTMLSIRALAVGYCLYCLWQIVQMFIEGGEEAPSIWLLLLAIAVLGGGSVWIAVITVLRFRQLKAEERARLDEEDTELARLAAEQEAEDAEDPEDSEEDMPKEDQ